MITPTDGGRIETWDTLTDGTVLVVHASCRNRLLPGIDADLTDFRRAAVGISETRAVPPCR